MYFDTRFFFSLFYSVPKGLPVTFIVLIFSLLIAFPAGFLLALIRVKKVPFYSYLVAIFVSFIRGTPIIVQIYVVYFSMPSLLVVLFSILNLNINIFDVNPLVYALTVFVLNTSATFCEIFRSALNTIGPAQMEAALSIGLTEGQAYYRIIISQMFEAACTNLATATTQLLKNTSLVFYMTLMDIMGIIKTKAAVEYNFFEGYVLAFLIYLVLCYGIESVWFFIENRLKRRYLRNLPKKGKIYAGSP